MWEKLLIDRDAVPPVLCGKMGLHVGFDLLPGRGVLNLNKSSINSATA